MSGAAAEEAHHSRGQILRICLKAAAVVALLGLLLALTLWAAYQPLGAAKLWVGLGIGLAKALLVVVIFMEQLRASTAARLAAATGVIWLGLMIGLTFADVGTRQTIPPGYGEDM